MKSPLRIALLLVAAACLVPTSAIAAGRPAATTGRASNVSPNAATLAGSVNPNGLVTTWYFQYGRTTNYGNRTTALDAGSGTKRVRVSSQLTSLRGNTLYHYRLVATNSAGTTRGNDRTFRTPEAPTVSTIAASPNPVTYLKPVVVSGFLLGPRGGGGKRVALEGNQFPYTAGFQQIGNTVVTAPNGGYQFIFAPFVVTQLRVVDRSDPSIVSPVLTENVAPRVSLHAKRLRGGRARFRGYITPNGASSVVMFQRKTRKGWKNESHAVPKNPSGKKSSRFSRRVRVKGGKYRAVARPASGAFVEGISKTDGVARRR